MANAHHGNTIYIDSTGTPLSQKNIRVLGVVVTATAASAVLNLQNDDGSTQTNKVNLRVATSGETNFFDFADSPLVFTDGIKASTVTNCVATIIIGG